MRCYEAMTFSKPTVATAPPEPSKNVSLGESYMTNLCLREVGLSSVAAGDFKPSHEVDEK